MILIPYNPATVQVSMTKGNIYKFAFPLYFHYILSLTLTDQCEINKPLQLKLIHLFCNHVVNIENTKSNMLCCKYIKKGS